MKASLIQQPALRLMTAKSASFPEGNRAAFESIEVHLRSLKGRKFCGLVYETNKGMEYLAGLVPDSEIEERKFAALGFEITEVPGGPCARMKLVDWRSKTEQIGPCFGAMIQEFGIDPSRPQMEYYRSLSELHLLLPVASGISGPET